MSTTERNKAGIWALALASNFGLQRQAARENLVALGRDATPILTRLLEDSHSRVRWEAALALKDIVDPAAAVALANALKDENGDVRWVAAEGLAAIGAEGLQPLLRTLMEYTDSFELRDAAHVAISLLEDPEQRELLAPVYRALKDGESPEVVMMAAAAALDVLERGSEPIS